MGNGRTLAFGQGGTWVGQVQFQPFDIGAKAGNHLAQATRHHARDHIGGQLQVPGIVKLAGFQHSPARARRIAAALDRDGGKGRFHRVAVVRVGRIFDHVIGQEIGHHKRAGADRAKVGFGAFGRLWPHAIGKLRGLQDRRLIGDESVIGIGGGASERHLDRGVIHRLDRCHAVKL